MSVNSSRFFVCKIFSCVVIRTHLLWFSSFFIFPATLGIVIGAPAAVFAGTIQNIQACESEINKAPRNLNSRIDSLQRQLACLKNYQGNEISNTIVATSTNTQSYQHNLDRDIELGLQYYRGMGVSQNYSKAGILFERAAIAGNPVGQLLLGALYYYGHGVLKDYEITSSSASDSISKLGGNNADIAFNTEVCPPNFDNNPYDGNNCDISGINIMTFYFNSQLEFASGVRHNSPNTSDIDRGIGVNSRLFGEI